MASLKPTAEVYNTGLFEGHLSLDNYVFLFGSAEKLHRPFLGALSISFFVTLTVTFSVLMTSASSVMRWPGSNFRSATGSGISCCSRWSCRR